MDEKSVSDPYTMGSPFEIWNPGPLFPGRLTIPLVMKAVVSKYIVGKREIFCQLVADDGQWLQPTSNEQLFKGDTSCTQKGIIFFALNDPTDVHNKKVPPVKWHRALTVKHPTVPIAITALSIGKKFKRIAPKGQKLNIPVSFWEGWGHYRELSRDTDVGEKCPW